MKKSILFVCYGLGIGGIEKCFVNLLNYMGDEIYDIDILLMNTEYQLKDQINIKVNYYDTHKYVMNTDSTLQEIQKHENSIQKLIKYINYARFRIRVKIGFQAWKTFYPIDKKYDIAIAYSQNDYSPYYVIDKVKATRKILWYHNGAYDRPYKKFKRDKKYYHTFDYVVAVSSDCKKMLQETFDFPEGKLIVLNNFYNINEIRVKSKVDIDTKFSKNVIHLVTVGRLTYEKGADLAVMACQLLVKRGYKVCWHWIGDGNQRTRIAAMIIKCGLQNYFILEGNKINPYPYINAADIYVQPSFYEAYSTTIVEARVLNKAIVATDVGGMRDQIKDGSTGLIAEISAISIADKIEAIIAGGLQEQLENTLKKELWQQEINFRQYEKTVFK